MRYFLIILFGSVPFFASAQVTIPTETARYFLERDDLARVLTRKDSLNTEIVLNLNQQLLIQNKIIETYKQDSATCNQVVKLKDEEMDILNRELKLAKKDARKQRVLKTLSLIGTGVLIVIALL